MLFVPCCQTRAIHWAAHSHSLPPLVFKYSAIICFVLIQFRPPCRSGCLGNCGASPLHVTPSRHSPPTHTSMHEMTLNPGEDTPPLETRPWSWGVSLPGRPVCAPLFSLFIPLLDGLCDIWELPLSPLLFFVNFVHALIPSSLFLYYVGEDLPFSNMARVNLPGHAPLPSLPGSRL